MFKFDSFFFNPSEIVVSNKTCNKKIYENLIVFFLNFKGVSIFKLEFKNFT